MALCRARQCKGERRATRPRGQSGALPRTTAWHSGRHQGHHRCRRDHDAGEQQVSCGQRTGDRRCRYRCRSALAGAVILGKTHTTEFAYLDPSPARNPHNLAHTPGGSSSGSAAAVAAGAVPLALGTQTVGSVNRPAAYCGVAAFKPSTRSTCTHGITALAPVFDTVGFYGTMVADAAALYDAVAPVFTASFDRASGPRYKIVRLEDATLESCDGEILKRVGDAARSIAGSGHAVRAAASPEDLAMMFETQLRVTHYEASRIYRTLLDLPVGPKLREMIGKGLALPETTYRHDRTRLAAARATFWAAFADTDAILFPATPQTAPAGLASTGDPRYIGPWTALGGPIVTQPIGHHINGLPIGMLVCGRPGSDRALARVACTLDSLSNRNVVGGGRSPI